MRLRLAFSLVLVPLLCSAASARPQLWDLYTRSGGALAGVTVERYESDSLYVRCMLSTIAIAADSIESIVRKNDAHTGTGLLLGTAAGALVATAIRVPRDNSPLAPLGTILAAPYVLAARVLVVVIGAVVGGAAGSASGADERYRLDRLSAGDRQALLRQLFPGGSPAERRLR